MIGSLSELKNRSGKDLAGLELHRPWIDRIKVGCRCGGTMERISDVADVWMDSGAASFATLHYPADKEGFDYWWPVDLVLEGHDQTRGWFYNQLGSSVLVFNKSPFRAVLMHGHTLDPEGEKMSKSRGNFASPADVIGKYGRDALRFYTLQATVWEDFRFSWNTIEATARDLQVIWNVFAFATLYMSLDKFDPGKWPLGRLSRFYRGEDKWLLSRTERLINRVTEHNERMEFHLSARALKEFVIEDLSHWYVRLVRRRFWLERESKDKLAAYAVLTYTLERWLKLAAPVVPFVTEKIYMESFRGMQPKGLDSVHMTSWPRQDRRWINKTLENEMRIAQHISEATASARQSKKIKLRQPVSEIMVVSDEPTVKRAVKALSELLLQQANTKRLRVVTVTEGERLKKLVVEPNYKNLGPAFRGEADQVAKILRTYDGRDLLQAFKNEGHFLLKLDKKDYKITRDMVTLKEEMPDNYAVGSFSEGRVYVDLTIPEDLVREGFVRDVIRRLQEMRKRLDLPVDAFADAYVSVPDAERLGWLEDERDTVSEEVRAKALLVLRPDQPSPKAMLEEDWEIGGHRFRMGMSRAEKESQIVQV